MNGNVPEGNLAEIGGILYGTTYYYGADGHGTVFQYNVSTGSLSALYSFQGVSDGLNPCSGVLAYNGTLYGACAAGAASNNGVIYSLTTSGKETILYTF